MEASDASKKWAHQFCLGKWATGILYLFPLGLFGLGWLYDYWTLNAQISERNCRARGLVGSLMGALTEACQRPGDRKTRPSRPALTASRYQRLCTSHGSLVR